ncbi:MAG: permease-like cell division protein FtsX [Clostridia bacterium]|nr:permease-like cell division protein FtsX [Clostridia bacterium]
MKYNILGYLIGEGFRNVFKNKKSTISCLIIMCATMLIFGIFFLIGENVKNTMREIESSQGFDVFIKNDATEAEIATLGDEIKAIEGVNTIQYKSKEDALTSMKERFKEYQYLLDGLYIFSPSYTVKLTDLELSESVQKQVLELDNVKKITSSDKTMKSLVALGKGINVITIIILVLLILISIFIISNTIKLTVHARRKEISIMKYIGATNNFIRSPFIVEGIIIGVVAAMLSVLLIGLSYNFIAAKLLSSSISDYINFKLLGFNDLFDLIVIVYLALGVGVGVVGSIISMRKYLKV